MSESEELDPLSVILKVSLRLTRMEAAGSWTGDISPQSVLTSGCFAVHNGPTSWGVGMDAGGELVEKLTEVGLGTRTEQGDGDVEMLRVDVDSDRYAMVTDRGSHYWMDVYENGRRTSTGSAATADGLVAMILSMTS